MIQHTIQMPAGIRYMSDAKDVIFSQLPPSGKYILDKALTGCGGTELFIGSGLPLVLISPRTGVLINKKGQHPECHLFRSSKDEKLDDLKNNLRTYLDASPILTNRPEVILTTLDSAKYVLDELNFRGTLGKYLFLVDEFQCLIGDAAFKGQTEMEFLTLLDSCAPNICYMSATPINSLYLEYMPEFQKCTYYRIDWDKNVVVEPTVKDILMKKGESPLSIFGNIISGFKRNGYFAKKLVGGVEYESKEVVVFVNEVKTIVSIIEKYNIQPDETTILISESNKYVKQLQSQGFYVGEREVDKDNPVNPPYTFCSKASFEGRDFYSHSAFTYIFLDGTKDWEVQDISIEIPQILGRQRKDENRFKYNATIYYRTKPNVETKEEFFAKMNEKLADSENFLNLYNSSDDKQKKMLANLVKGRDPNNPYSSNYLDVVDNSQGGYDIGINYLVAAADHNLWLNKTFFYNNPLHLTTAIQSQMALVGTKPDDLRRFEDYFNKESNPDNRMRCYATFRDSHPQPQYIEALYQNPFIDFDYHKAYETLGSAELANLSYDMTAIKNRLLHDDIVNLCKASFVRGRSYRADEVKTILQGIYAQVGYAKKATASQLQNYIPVNTPNQRMSDGSRQVVYKLA